MQIKILGEMRSRLFQILTIAILFCACNTINDNPYEGDLVTLKVSLNYPDGFDSYVREGVNVRLEDINLGHVYISKTDADGKAQFEIPSGLYRLVANDRSEEYVFNASVDNIRLSSGDTSQELQLRYSKAGSLIIKEIYCGGCKRAPIEGTYQADQYIIIHNNHFEVQYLDSLCFGTMVPYNSTATNPFMTKDEQGNNTFPDFVPIADAVWQFGGTGTSFPLQPGEDAVLCIRAAINHSDVYPLSVNLNNPEYFVMYDANLFTNKTYNPAPGDKIQSDHILKCLIKTNPSINATMISLNSPTLVLYKAKSMSMEEFIMRESSVVPIPGSTVGAKVLACPIDWVLDAVEVFNGASSVNVKRLCDELDAGYATLSETFASKVLARKKDEMASESSLYEVLVDSNNSSEDFVELSKQSLRNE